MATVKYQYSSTNPPVALMGNLEPVIGTFNNNPIFNFNQAFLDSLNSISPTELGSAVPYISLKILDPAGGIVENVSLAFFHKPFDASQINSDLRYSERPIMSLKDISLKTNLASGYLYYNNVTMNIRIHRPEALGSTFLIALLFPGMPFLLEYGWSAQAGSVLDEKDILLFAVKTYSIHLDASGQIDLTIEGTAFNERFNTTLVGDTGEKPSDNSKTTSEELDGLENERNKLLKFSQYLSDTNRRSNSTINDYSILKQFAEVYKKIENKARGSVSEKFSKSVQDLSQVIFKNDFGPNLKGRDTVKFHDLLYILCNDTFSSIGKLVSGVNEFRVIYGTFNSKAGRYANDSIAEFPIDLKNFKNKIKNNIDNGSYVPNIGEMLNILFSDFFENEDYFKSDLAPNPNSPLFEPDVFNKPDIVSHFISRSQKDPNNPQNDIIVMELYIVDINNGLPITTNQLVNLNRASQDQAEQQFLALNFPIIRLGHANSFIKSISLDQVSDEHMKAALIERMTRDRITSTRDTITQKDSLGANPVTPLTLPLKGNAEVVGHPAWKPFRAFYLSTGFFLIDGVYKITSVTHTLAAGQFNTNIEFMWH